MIQTGITETVRGSLQVLPIKTTAKVGDNVCEKHQIARESVRKPFDGKLIYFCKVCAADQEIREQLARVSEQTKAKQERINKMLGASCLGKRFLDKTFENYRFDHIGQNAAVEKAKHFLETMDRGLGLIMSGPCGTGKSHLAAAIVHEAIEKYGKTALVTTAMKIIRTVKESWNQGATYRESQIVSNFILPDVLVIDEIGVQYGSLSERLVLNEIVNDRYNELKPTILISNLVPKDIEEALGDRIFDRFKEGGACVVMKWPSYRTSKD